MQLKSSAWATAWRCNLTFSQRREAFNINACMLRHLLVHLLASGHAVLSLVGGAVCVRATAQMHIHAKCHSVLHTHAFILCNCSISAQYSGYNPPPPTSWSLFSFSRQHPVCLSAPPSSLNVPVSFASQVLLSKRWANAQIMTHLHVIMSDYCHITGIGCDRRPPRYHL